MLMMLLLHVTVAIISMIWSTWLFFQPSKIKLNVAYGMTGLTLASGSFLVFQARSHLLEACLAGIFYLSAVSVGIVAARHKLSLATSTNETASTR